MTAQPLPSDTSPAALTLSGVHFAYCPGCEVVSGVTADLRPGRVTALIGPNAAGKSTLLKLMLGQLAPTGGSVRSAGCEVSAIPPRERAGRMSYVPQRGGVSFAFTVHQLVDMARFATGCHPYDVERAMVECEVSDLADRPFAELSGGQQQRVLVARALAQAPSEGGVMLLDEPSSNMDLRHQHGLMALLRQQAAMGLAVLVVLHDVNLAAGYADDVWLMEAGRLIAAGSWREVLTVERLEPVYGVPLQRLETGGRPVFLVARGGTLDPSG